MEVQWRGIQSEITFYFTWAGATTKKKLQARSEMQSVIINEQKSGKAKKLFSSSAIKHRQLWNRSAVLTAWWKRPIRDSTDSDDYKMFDASLAAMTHFCTAAGVIKNVRTNVIASRCFPVVLGFLSLDFLREEMFAHAAQPLPTIQCVSVRRQSNASRTTQIHRFPEVNVVIPQWSDTTSQVKVLPWHFYWWANISSNVCFSIKITSAHCENRALWQF